MLVNILGITDAAKCYEMVRQLRWPDGIRCPRYDAAQVVKQERDDTEPHRQRYECRSCGRSFDALTHTIFAGHHQLLRVWALVLYFLGLNLSNEQIARELDLDPDDADRMTTLLREGGVQRKPEVTLSGEVGCDEVYVVAGHKGHLEVVRKRATRPPEANPADRRVGHPHAGQRQAGAISPMIRKTIAPGSVVYTDEYDIYHRLPQWGYARRTVCHPAGEFARDDDGDGFCEVHVNTLEEFWSLLHSWLRPHRWVPQESLPLYLGFFEFVHNVRARGKRLLASLIGFLLAPPRNPS